jgi:hypothetical protein
VEDKGGVHTHGPRDMIYAPVKYVPPCDQPRARP